jgi:hypothetical protein
MKTEKEIDTYIVEKLKKNKIDFYHIPNAASKGQTANYFTEAFDAPFQCHKYVSDFILPINGSVIWIENGMKTGSSIRHKDRKQMQKKRSEYWAKNGGIKHYQIFSKVSAEKVLKEIGVIK